MSMNSFSARAEAVKAQQAQEKELSGLLDLHPEGSNFPLAPVRSLAARDFQPLDFKSLREEWYDKSGGRRAAPRYDLKLTVLIANHYRAFRTQCQNISASGLLLKDLLPLEFSKHVFDIVLIHYDVEKKTFILFRGRAVSEFLRSRRVQFESMTTDSKVKLQKLFETLEKAG